MFAWRAVFGAILVGGVAGIGFGVGERPAGAAVTCTQQPCVWMTDFWNGGNVYIPGPPGSGTSTKWPNGSFAVHKDGATMEDARNRVNRDQKAFPNVWHNQNNGTYENDTVQVTLFVWSNFDPNCNQVNGAYPPLMGGTAKALLVSTAPEQVVRNHCKPPDVPGG